MPSELAFLRFVAGMRALLAALFGILLLVDGQGQWRVSLSLVAPYLAWSAVLLYRTLSGARGAGTKLWLWLDAAVLLVITQMLADTLPLFGITVVLPVIALAVLAGALQAMALAFVVAAAMVLMTGSLRSLGELPPLPVAVPLVVLALGPAAALLARPSRELRERLTLLDVLNQRFDPRKGLRHHLDVLIEQLHQHFAIGRATISLQGPEPRVFQWRPDAPCVELADDDAITWRDRLAALPRDLGCLVSKASGGEPGIQVVDPDSGAFHGALDSPARQALQGIRPQAITLPLMNYGQPLGTICLQRPDLAFSKADLLWLHEVMRETMPLLERADLLEQLQRESASRERERIGRDLHDSAVQPYLGLKYGLEAVARQARPDNPVHEPLRQLVQITTDELQTLRDVISGLRSGNDPQRQDSAPLSALERQARRFEALYGLRVHIFAPDASRLRGSAAKAVLHMVNEALTNVRRHTSATGVTVLLDVNKTDVVLRLRNDHGHGEPLIPDFLPRSLTERATEFGGGVQIDHQPDFTEIVITLPLLGAIG